MAAGKLCSALYAMFHSRDSRMVLHWVPGMRTVLHLRGLVMRREIIGLELYDNLWAKP